MNPKTEGEDIRKQDLHCLACQVELKTTHRENVEIDYCPLCQAIWLQRGELNAIIERSIAAHSPLRKETAVHNSEWFDFG